MRHAAVRSDDRDAAVEVLRGAPKEEVERLRLAGETIDLAREVVALVLDAIHDALVQRSPKRRVEDDDEKDRDRRGQNAEERREPGPEPHAKTPRSEDVGR